MVAIDTFIDICVRIIDGKARIFSLSYVADALGKDGLYSSDLVLCTDRRRGDSLHPLDRLRVDA